MAKMKMAVEGMSCEHCADRIRRALAEEGVILLGINLAKKEIEIEPQTTDISRIVDTISDLGFTAREL